MTIIYDHHVFSSCMIIIYYHHILSSYVIILCYHHVYSSYLIIIYYHHLLSSSIIITYYDHILLSYIVITYDNKTKPSLGSRAGVIYICDYGHKRSQAHHKHNVYAHKHCAQTQRTGRLRRTKAVSLSNCSLTLWGSILAPSPH